MTSARAMGLLLIGCLGVGPGRAELRLEERDGQRSVIRVEAGREVWRRRLGPRPGTRPLAMPVAPGIDKGALEGAVIMDDPSSRLEQGALTTCVYCTRVRPGPAADCPVCRGRPTRLRPARMMDGPTSRRELLASLTALSEPLEAWRNATGDADRKAAAARLRERLLGVLADLDLYGFDLAEALAEAIRELEE